MTPHLVGISGTLLPGRYIATDLEGDGQGAGGGVDASLARRIAAWWTSVESSTGPATPIRELFDRVAMPLCALLGFSAHDARFDGRLCRVRLTTRRDTPVALVVVTWAERPSMRWAAVAAHARDIGASWGLLLAPPFLSVLPTRGHAVRHSVDVSLADAARSGTLLRALPLLQAASFDPVARDNTGASTIDLIVDRASLYQDAVRADLQFGVEASLRALQPAIVAASRGVRGRARRGRGVRGRAGPAEDAVSRAAAGGRAHQTRDVAAFDEALTLIYRVLFLLFAESRQLVPADSHVYRDAYAVSRFCVAAADGQVDGLWDAMAATSRLSRLGCRTADVDLSPFNGPLFARAAAPTLERGRRGGSRRRDALVRDDAMRQTLVALGTRVDRAGRSAISYRDLGVEQLGAVYERVLDLDHDALASPRAEPAAPPAPRAPHRHSRARKQTGTFYTPQPLADFVVRRTLAPLTEGAPADAILALRVLDPAMGSGAFLVAACRFLAQAYEDALVDEGRLAPADIDDDTRADVRRAIAERCLYGVDRNPTAVQVARLSLWLTALARDKPLNFLDHRLRTGDSLVGAWPSDLHRLSMRRSNASESRPLFDAMAIDDTMRAATKPLWSLLARHDDTVADVHARELDWRRFQSKSSPLQRWRLAAHLWCARWFADKPPDAAEMRALLAALLRNDRMLGQTQLDRRAAGAEAAASARNFFHWPLEFPDVFHAPDGQPLPDSGFDAVLGNPPWEMVRRDDGEARAEQRLVRYVRESGQYPSCTSGHLNLYQAFVDRAIALARPGGRIGLVLPWGLATDDGAARLRARLMDETAVDAIVGLDNASGLFPIHRGLRFMALVTTTGRATERFAARFGVKTGAELDDLPARGRGPDVGVPTPAAAPRDVGAPPPRAPNAAALPVSLTPGRLRFLGGKALRIPDARRSGDIELLAALVQRFPALGEARGWQVSFGRELNATDARPFHAPHGIPIVEGKHLTPFVVDASDAARLRPEGLRALSDPGRVHRPRVGYRDVSGVGNRLTLIAAVVPAGVVTTHTVFCLREPLEPVKQRYLCALLNSYVLNWIVRLLMGGHVTTGIVEDLPAPAWSGDDRDLEIAELAASLEQAAAPPVTPIGTEDAARLQSLVAHRYALTRDELRHVLGAFPLVPPPERAEVLRRFDADSRIIDGTMPAPRRFHP
jgi:hypothetical protein